MVLIIVWRIVYKDLYYEKILEDNIRVNTIYITGDLSVNSKPTIIFIYIVP